MRARHVALLIGAALVVAAVGVVLYGLWKVGRAAQATAEGVVTAAKAVSKAVPDRVLDPERTRVVVQGGHRRRLPGDDAPGEGTAFSLLASQLPLYPNLKEAVVDWQVEDAKPDGSRVIRLHRATYDRAAHALRYQKAGSTECHAYRGVADAAVEALAKEHADGKRAVRVHDLATRKGCRHAVERHPEPDAPDVRRPGE